MPEIEIEIAGQKIFELFGLTFTNTFILALLLSWGVFFLFLLVFRKGSVIPGKIQNFLEFILETFYNFAQSITQDDKKTKAIFPVAATLFLVILSANLIELVPGVGVFHFLRSPSSDLNFTIALALFSVFYLNFLVIKHIGLLSFLGKFFNFKNPIFFFVGILEIISEISRIFSLAIRLFGNLFAGEVLLIVVSLLFTFIIPVPFLALEILVGFIQAFIFSSLVIIFYTASSQLEHG